MIFSENFYRSLGSECQAACKIVTETQHDGSLRDLHCEESSINAGDGQRWSKCLDCLETSLNVANQPFLGQRYQHQDPLFWHVPSIVAVLELACL